MTMENYFAVFRAVTGKNTSGIFTGISVNTTRSTVLTFYCRV